MNLDEAATALLSLSGPSLQAERMNRETVRFEVFSVKSKRGQLLTPLHYELEVEVFVTFDESAGRYRFSGRAYERTRFSTSTETFRGVYRRREWGKHLTFDGIVPVKFDTGAVFDRIEEVLKPLGWNRA